MEQKKRVAVLFNKYVEGEASQTEIKELLDLVKTEYLDSDLEEEMESLWNKQNVKAGEDVDWQRIYQKTLAADIPVRSIHTSRRNWMRAAAALFIGMCSMAIWLNIHKTFKLEDTRYVTGKAMPGKTLIVFLNDGTKVTLNSGSELRYPETFRNDKREVYLEGEAYFEVAHNPQKSFLVHSGKIVTSVLGTSFNVMAYKGLSNIAVTVLTGKVAVKNIASQQMVTLTPQQRVMLSDSKIAFKIDSVKDLSELVAWQKGELVFNNVTLEEIALKVGYRYGIKVDITDESKSQRRITGTFNKQSFLEIMTAITRLTETHFKAENDIYAIY